MKNRRLNRTNSTHFYIVQALVLMCFLCLSGCNIPLTPLDWYYGGDDDEPNFVSEPTPTDKPLVPNPGEGGNIEESVALQGALEDEEPVDIPPEGGEVAPSGDQPGGPPPAIQPGVPPPVVEGGEYTFSDDTFASLDWTEIKIVDDIGDGSFVAIQEPMDGNPGAFRHLTHEWSGPGDIITVHVYYGEVIDPAIHGAIRGIDFSFDLILLEGGSSGAVAYFPLIVQEGSYYNAGRTLNATENYWQAFGYDYLTVDDFTKISGAGPEQPDFSRYGSPIQFGYVASNGRSFEGGTQTISGLDNWSVTVYTRP